MYTLKSIAKRGTAFMAVFALLAATLLPSLPAFADELNPLTERSLLLTSSAPGFTDTDGSGNSDAAPNSVGENYAPAGSGPNGMKTGETFTFKVSSTATVKAFTLQYCTTAAGVCQAPGDNDTPAGYTTGDARNGVYAETTNEDGRLTNDDAHLLGASDFDFVGNFSHAAAALADGEFEVYIDGTPTTETWAFTKENVEDDAHSDHLTGKNNYITLTSATGQLISNGQEVQIVFEPSETVYITNPGSGSFFVKINTYNSDTDQINPINDPTPLVTTDQTVIDGGVTVANVMTDSIHITTKVLETMSFSVGTQNPDTQDLPHGTCSPMLKPNNNRLNMGNPNAEYSLEIDQAYDTFSYWRLSSNSSGGATVYYSGNTLANTVGDEIAEMGAEANSQLGTEQFGLALVDAGLDTMDTEVNYSFPDTWVTPTIDPLVIGTEYDEGDTASISDEVATNNAKFAFYKSSNEIPEVIAQNNSDVIDCATSKVRYVANIAPSTPAGVYTTKINYLAAPQY